MTYRTPDGLLRNVQQQRLTPKSEFLLRLEELQQAVRRQSAQEAQSAGEPCAPLQRQTS